MLIKKRLTIRKHVLPTKNYPALTAFALQVLSPFIEHKTFLTTQASSISLRCHH